MPLNSLYYLEKNKDFINEGHKTINKTQRFSITMSRKDSIIIYVGIMSTNNVMLLFGEEKGDRENAILKLLVNHYTCEN